MHPALTTFLERMDGLVSSTDDPHKIADVTGDHLAGLLAHPVFLEDRHREASEDGYNQHVVHVHPRGLYSLVSLVWMPGQVTPVHDHRCWCVVGVLEGLERETRYSFHAAGDEQWLVDKGSGLYQPGQICRLVPPEEDIHKVANGGPATAISLHVYGANIAEVGTSINHTFDQPVRTGVGPDARQPWRGHC